MNPRTLVAALAALTIAGVLAAGLAAGRAWGRATAAAAVEAEQRDRLRAMEEELVTLQHRLERHARVQNQLVEEALDCRVAVTDRHLGRRLELALGSAAPQWGESETRGGAPSGPGSDRRERSEGRPGSRR
jgi:predicted phage gp36 major capsid-like protein